MTTENKQASFEGWALVEMMGHRREIGFVTTENYGAAALFRIDTPGLPEREYALEQPAYVEGKWAPVGSIVKRPESPARSVLIGPGSVYALNPCTEDAALKAIDSMQARPLILLKLAEQPRLEVDASYMDDMHDDEEEMQP